MTPRPHTHADDINSLEVAREAKRLAEFLRHWCEQINDVDPTSIDHACRLADSLDRWADEQAQAFDSSVPIVHASSATSRKRPRATELPSVASLMGQASPGRPTLKLAPPNTLPKVTNASRKLPSPRPTISEMKQAPPPVEVEPKPRRSKEPIEPTPSPVPVDASASRATIATTGETRDVIQQRPSRSFKTVARSEPRVRSGREFASNELPAPLFQCTAKADRSDINIPARWWNIPVAITLLVGIAVAIGGIGVEVMRVAHSQAVVARVLNDPKASGDQIVAAARGMRSSPLARWDANRELLIARATLLAMERSTGISSIDQSTQRENARILFRRAADRHPQSPWHRMNVALAAPATLAAGYWEKLAPLASHEPTIVEQAALYQIRAGNRAQGFEEIGKTIQSQPTSASRLARSLLNSGASINELMSVIPDSPDAIGGLLTILQTDAVIGLRRAIEERLTQLTLRATNSDGMAWESSDWAEWGEIEARLERWSEAAAKFERAIELDPTHVRYKLLLASVRTEQQNTDEAKRLLSELPVKLSAQEETQRRNILAKLAPPSPTAPVLSRASAN